MFARTLVLAAVLTASASAHAADWVADPARSRIAFSGVQVGVPFKGRFKRFDARIAFDPAAPESGHALVEIDLSSAETGDRQRDDAMPQAEWFAVKANPTARFEATRFVARGGDGYDAVGTLTVRGVRRDATLPFRLTLSGPEAHAVGHLDLVRTQFGVGQGPWATGEWVALDVGVDVDLVAVAKPQP